MAEHLLGQLHTRAHQEGGPVDRVEPHDVLADQVQVGGPVFPVRAFFRVAEPADVVGQRVDPNVHHVVFGTGHLHAPVEAGAADGKIAQTAFDEAHHLVSAAVGLDEVWLAAVQVQQLVLILRQAEEPAFLHRPFDRSALRRQLLPPLACHKLLLVVEGLVAHRIPTLIPVQIEVAIGFHLAPQRLARRMVTGFGRSDEAIVGDVQQVEQIAEIAAHLIGQSARGLALLLRLARHLQAVFVSAGLEAHLAPLQALEPGDNVCSHRLVGVADMRLAVRIVDCGGDIVRVSHWPRL